MIVILTIYFTIALVTFIGTVFINNDFGYEIEAAAFALLVSICWPLFVLGSIIILIGDFFYRGRVDREKG